MSRDIRVSSGADGSTPQAKVSERTIEPRPTAPRAAAGTTAQPEPSLGELFRDLAQESSILVKQEIGLAKAEMRENLREFAKDAMLVAAGGGILMVAMLVFTAFLVAGLGDMLGNEYWLGALIVGVVYAVIGGVLLMRGRSGMQRDDLRPEQTLESLQANKQWARTEAKQVKRDLTTSDSNRI